MRRVHALEIVAVVCCRVTKLQIFRKYCCLTSTLLMILKLVIYLVEYIIVILKLEIELFLTATLPGMWERTVTIGSAGKTFSITGWKVQCQTYMK